MTTAITRSTDSRIIYRKHWNWCGYRPFDDGKIDFFIGWRLIARVSDQLRHMHMSRSTHPDSLHPIDVFWRELQLLLTDVQALQYLLYEGGQINSCWKSYSLNFDVINYPSYRYFLHLNLCCFARGIRNWRKFRGGKIVAQFRQCLSKWHHKYNYIISLNFSPKNIPQCLSRTWKLTRLYLRKFKARNSSKKDLLTI